MSTPIVSVPEVILASEFPTLADRPAGLYNQKAAAWASSENAMVTRAREIAVVTHSNAVAAGERAQAAATSATNAADSAFEAKGFRDNAASSASTSATNATKTAEDRQAVEEAIIEGPVLSVHNKTGIVTLIAEDVGAVPQGSSASLTRYDLASAAATAALNLTQQQVFRVNASIPRTITLTNTPGANRAMTVVIHITGNSPVTWPASIAWDDEEAPELGDNFTRIVLFWDGVMWSGFAGAVR